MDLAIGKQRVENRIRKRKPYAGHILFASKNGFHEGRLKNYSPSGLFIKTSAFLSIGEIITIALPYLNTTQTKYKGQILWRNREGVGVELFKKRNDFYDYIRLH